MFCGALYDLAMFCLAQGDTVVDCFEVCSSEPFLTQGKS